MKGPLWCAITHLRHATAVGVDFPRDLYDGLNYLARLANYVQSKHEPLQAWLPTVLERLEATFPVTPDDPLADLFSRNPSSRMGPRVSREVFDLENELADARRAVSNAGAALLRREAGALSDFRAAQERVLRAERELADARSQEHAIPCPGFPAWDTGAPHPHLFTRGSKTALVYLTREPDPTWDGRTARIVDPEDEELHLVAIVQFHRTVSVRTGSPNDEVIEGHPLFGKGLSAYEAHTVVRSSWLAELRQINAVHSAYDATWWERYRHYLLAFHDETFECLAEDFTVTTKLTSLKNACRDALEDVMG